MSHPFIDSVLERYADIYSDTSRMNSFAQGDSQEDLRTLFEAIANAAYGEVYEGYSGRGMYGRQCWGISGNAAKILEVAGAHALMGASFDSLGVDSIVYWPRIPYDPSDD